MVIGTATTPRTDLRARGFRRMAWCAAGLAIPVVGTVAAGGCWAVSAVVAVGIGYFGAKAAVQTSEALQNRQWSGVVLNEAGEGADTQADLLAEPSPDSASAADKAKELGYDRKGKDPPFNSHGQPVFTNGKDYTHQMSINTTVVNGRGLIGRGGVRAPLTETWIGLVNDVQRSVNRYR